MGFIRTRAQTSKEGVELRETSMTTSQATPNQQARAAVMAPVASVPPTFSKGGFTSKDASRHKVGKMRSNYRTAANSGISPPIRISSTADTQSSNGSGHSAMSHSPTLSAPNPDALSPLRPTNTLGASAMLHSQPSSDSLKTSQRASLYPAGDFRNSSMPDVNDMKTEIMCTYLHQQQLKKMWSHGGNGEGVLLKKSRDDYHCCPPDLQLQRGGIFDAVRGLNVRVSRKVVECITRADRPVCNDSQHPRGTIVP